MKKTIVFVLAMMTASTAWADKECPMPVIKNSAEFAAIKGLAGHWAGTAKHADGKEEQVVVEYRVTSGGSAVEEKLFPATPHEMISMYHDRSGKLAMTHYCMLGNQPQVVLKSAAGGRIRLEASAETQKSLAGQPYMSSVVIEQPAPDQLVETWSGVDANGKIMDSTVFTLKKN